jgi:D-alanyl-D-alanine carboxypeptidase
MPPWKNKMTVSRRALLQTGVLAAAAAKAGFWIEDAHAQSAADKYRDLFAPLDRFVEQYMRAMNSPGMTLVLADRDGVHRVVTYGFGDLESKRKVDAGELFHIGSISKSFIALVLLQLHDEGKLDLQRPVAEYLPWFPVASSFAPITTHHLLTHTSGLPGASDVFLSDPAQRHLAAYAPGQQFHYNNMAYALLGHLAWTLDGRELPRLFRERIFQPLGMTKSEPIIDFDMRERTVKNYAPLLSDRPYPRFGKLCEAPMIALGTAAGCIASTAGDMGLYLRMIANRGRGPKANLISSQGFELFSKPHIKAEDFGPTASYGYGVAVDQLEGNTILRHTGGMVSFMSSMMVNLDEGVGAFASINAQQGYRPSPVVEYAIQLMRAHRQHKALPTAPQSDLPTRVENASDYQGVFTSSDGRKLEFASEADRLFVLHQGKRVALEKAGAPDRFLASDTALGRFALVFGRKQADAKPPAAVVEVSWGGDWYTNAAYTGPKQFDYPKEWDSYVGHYRNESPWISSTRVVIVKGKLTLDGVTPLEADGKLFRLRSEPGNTEYIQFGPVVNGKCMRLKFSGEDLWRIPAA